MLLESGDLIPVKRAAADIPWTKRKSQVQNFLHRGPVEFSTFVYDTNVGDIAPLSTYFNPYHWTVEDLNHKFGIKRAANSDHGIASPAVVTAPSFNLEDSADAKCRSLQPKLFIYPLEENNETETSLCCGIANIQPSSGSLSNEFSFGSIFRPKAVRPSISGHTNHNSPGSPDSPERRMWLPVSVDESDSLFRPFSISPTGSLEPIGPPKRRKMAVPSPTSSSNKPAWPKIDTLKNDFEATGESNIRNSYFSILSEDSPWSPWMSTTLVPRLTESIDKRTDSNGIEGEADGLVSSLRQFAQESNVFFS